MKIDLFCSFVRLQCQVYAVLQLYVTSQEEPISIAQYVSSFKNGEKKMIVSSINSDSGDLSLSALQRQAVETDLETDREAVEPCHVEPEVHDAKSDHDGRKGEQKTATVEAKKFSTI